MSEGGTFCDVFVPPSPAHHPLKLGRPARAHVIPRGRGTETWPSRTRPYAGPVQIGTDFETTAIVAVGVAVAVITLTIVMGVRALRRPLSDEQYRGEQWEAGLLGVLAVSGLILLGVALISLALWFISGVAGGMGG
jgi:hypothetical protein